MDSHDFVQVDLAVLEVLAVRYVIWVHDEEKRFEVFHVWLKEVFFWDEVAPVAETSGKLNTVQ